MFLPRNSDYDTTASIHDPNTLYNITDDSNPTLSMLELLYPVGSIYIGTMSACPLQTLGVGTWQLVAQDRVLQGAGTRGSVGNTVNEKLPNITGNLGSIATHRNSNPINDYKGAFRANATDKYSSSDENGTYRATGVNFNASRSSSTYQDNAPVQQDAYLVNIWERIS